MWPGLNTLISFPKHICQLIPFTFAQARGMAGLLLPDTKLIALKPDIYCYFTSLDLGLAVQGSLKSLLYHHSLTAAIH